MLTAAKGGGSITPRYARILQRHCDSGRLVIQQSTRLVDGSWDPAAQAWTMTTEPCMTLPPCDHVVYATGVSSDFATLPVIQPLLCEHPIHTKGGLPCLTHDLMWSDEVPCLVTGRFAGLRLGPGAANLMGARHGAERVAWTVERLLGKRPVGAMDDYICGLSNQFGVLSAEDK